MCGPLLPGAMPCPRRARIMLLVNLSYGILWMCVCAGRSPPLSQSVGERQGTGCDSQYASDYSLLWSLTPARLQGVHNGLSSARQCPMPSRPCLCRLCSSLIPPSVTPLPFYALPFRILVSASPRTLICARMHLHLSDLVCVRVGQCCNAATRQADTSRRPQRPCPATSRPHTPQTLCWNPPAGARGGLLVHPRCVQAL